MSERPAAELLPPAPSGRTFSCERTVRLGDVDPDGELRLDAMARYLQDIASDDALDAALPNALGWVVRRTMLRVDAPVEAGERVHLTTFCTGSGRSWAERRTTITGARRGAVEAVTLWVQVDMTTGRPARLGDEFHTIYGEAAGERVVSSKLSLPGSPPASASFAERPWRYRRTDLDQFDHVNNAAHWAVVEEVIQRAGRPRHGTAELEYLLPADADVDLTLVTDGDDIWVQHDGATVTVARWTTA